MGCPAQPVIGQSATLRPHRRKVNRGTRPMQSQWLAHQAELHERNASVEDAGQFAPDLELLKDEIMANDRTRN